MWIDDFTIPPNQIKEPTVIYRDAQGQKVIPNFPVAVVGIGSYLWDAQIQSNLAEIGGYCYNLQIGNYCSIAKNVHFILDRNHDYKAVSTAKLPFLPAEENPSFFIRRKGQILIENDVWVGHGATIMSGITIHDGAVVAAMSVVTKDVPPYAIVGGNPAKIIGYRFSAEQIQKLLTIRWWHWETERLENNAPWFREKIEAFIQQFYLAPPVPASASVDPPQSVPEPKHGFFSSLFKKKEESPEEEKPEPVLETKTQTYLFVLDCADSYPLWEQVVTAFCKTMQGKEHVRLLLWNPFGTDSPYLTQLNLLLKPFEGKVTTFIVNDEAVSGTEEWEQRLFGEADYFITSRNVKTLYYVGYAEKHDLAVISGVDIPLFDTETAAI